MVLEQFAESSHTETKATDREIGIGITWAFETSKLVSQGYTLSNKAIPPYPFQTLLQTGDQLFNYISLWGAFYSNITDTIQTLSNPATYLRNIKLVLIFVDVLFCTPFLTWFSGMEAQLILLTASSLSDLSYLLSLYTKSRVQLPTPLILPTPPISAVHT
jgi:hypothetical protein